jgi:hypothetical protein
MVPLSFIVATALTFARVPEGFALAWSRRDSRPGSGLQAHLLAASGFILDAHRSA